MTDNIQPNSLLKYYSSKYSQRGQDGILAEIFRRIGISKGFFVELGAWDGIHMSNCRSLYDQGWGGLFIEALEDRYKDLVNNYKQYPHIYTHKAMVTTNGTTLDTILKKYSIDSKMVNFISIDIDGLDLNMFESLTFSPDVVLVEGGFSWSPHLKDRVPDTIAGKDLQQPLAVVFKVARSKGYDPVCFCQDTYLVKKKYANKFKGIDKNHVTLYADAFNYVDDELRDWLISMRDSNEDIKTFETEHLKGFNSNPLVKP